MDARRRLSILSSHLRPAARGFYSDPNTSHLIIAAATCVSGSDCQRRRFCDSGGTEDNKGILKDPCVFCRIVRGESPAFKLYEDDTCLCILDTSPVSHGHSLIIPKSHFSSLQSTPPSVIAEMCSKVPLIGNAIMKATDSDSYNLLVNNGAAAGQVIFHTHIHIIPRKAHDCLWTTESLRRHPLNFDRTASELVDCVREQLSIASEDSKGQESSLP